MGSWLEILPGGARPRLALAAHQSRPRQGVAVKVSQTIRTGTRATVWATPVIVVWGEFAQVVGGDTCKFVLGDSVARWLKDQPARIAPGRVEQIAEAVASALPGLDVTRRWSRSVRRQS